MTKRLLAVFGLAWLLAGVATAGPVEDAAVAWMRGDYETAYTITKPLAEGGDANAQYSLAGHYVLGRGVPKNYFEGARWLLRAAEQGYMLAQTAIGDAYQLGRGVPQDFVSAHMWLNLAAARGDARCALCADSMRDTVAKLMSPAQIAEAQKLAREWKPKPEH